MAKKVNKVQTGIRFTPKLLYKISFAATQNMCSLNAQLEFLAKQCVQTCEAENGEILLDESQVYKK